jgi:hypothetical protein
MLGDGKQTRFIRVTAQDEPTAGLVERYVQQAIAQRLLDRSL